MQWNILTQRKKVVARRQDPRRDRGGGGEGEAGKFCWVPKRVSFPPPRPLPPLRCLFGMGPAGGESLGSSVQEVRGGGWARLVLGAQDEARLGQGWLRRRRRGGTGPTRSDTIPQASAPERAPPAAAVKAPVPP